MVFRRSPGLGNANLGARESGEPSAFRWSLAACWAVRVFPAPGDGPISTLQMFPVPPREPSSLKSELLGTDSPGYMFPWVPFHWLGFMAGNAGETQMFLFPFL